MKDNIYRLVSKIPPDLIINTSIAIMESPLTRRDFLKLTAKGVAAALTAACLDDDGKVNETTQTPEAFRVNAQELTINNGLIICKEVMNEINSVRPIDPSRLNAQVEEIKKCEDFKKITGGTDFDGWTVVDKNGKERDYVVMSTKDVSSENQSLYYLAMTFDHDPNVNAFVPRDEASEDITTRLFPIGYVRNEVSGVVTFGLLKPEGDGKNLLSVPLFDTRKLDDGTVAVRGREIYTNIEYQVQDAPDGIKKILASHTEIPEVYLQISDKLEGSDYQINGNGEILLKNDKGEYDIVKGIKVDKDGNVKLTYIGTNKDYLDKVYNIEKQVFLDSLVVSERKFVFTDQDGMLWAHDDTTGNWLPELNRDTLKPSENPYINREILYSKEFKLHIEKMIEKGKFNTEFDDAKPLEAGDLKVTYDDDGGDFRCYWEPTDKAKGKYTNVKQMPVQIGAIYNSHHIDGTPIYAIVSLWKDLSDKLKPIVFIASDRREELGNNELHGKITTLGLKTNKRIATGYYYGSIDLAAYYLELQGYKSPEMVADWVYNNQKEQVNSGIIKRWIETGEIDTSEHMLVLQAGSVPI